MALFKRVELWILLLLAGGAIAFVLYSNRGETGGGNSSAGTGTTSTGGPASQGNSPLTLNSFHLKRDVGNAILEIHLAYNNASSEPLHLIPPAVRLLSGTDPDDAPEEVPPFFLAFAPPPIIGPGATDEAILKYWLEKRHLENGLWLDIEGNRAPVKGAAPLDLETLPDQETTVFSDPNWAAAVPHE